MVDVIVLALSVVSFFGLVATWVAMPHPEAEAATLRARSKVAEA
ncbi:MAG: hypothetical protein U0821_07095 [Chloroflexota bacterium]